MKNKAIFFLTLLSVLFLFLLCACAKKAELTEERWDRIPMVMIDGTLYLDTGSDSAADGRCGVMDGEITSTVEGSELPQEDDQSNFGVGYAYQYGAQEGTVELDLNGSWRIFATEEVRESMQFSEREENTDRLGLTLEAKNVTPSGMTIVFTQSGGNPTGELQTGADYWVEVWNQDQWEAIDVSKELVWTSEAYLIEQQGSTEFAVDWRNVYGALQSGKYRLGKTVMDFRGTQDFDIDSYYAEFTIE